MFYQDWEALKPQQQQALSVGFGVEIEFGGLYRMKAIEVVRDVIEPTAVLCREGHLDGCYFYDLRGRKWTICKDGSVNSFNREECELVTPILYYKEDITSLCKVVIALRSRGAQVDDSCGIHVHIKEDGHTYKTLLNWCSIIYSKFNLFKTSLKFDNREDYCRGLEGDYTRAYKYLLDKQTIHSMEDLKREWYRPDTDMYKHYNYTRYHFLNLHSYFQGKGIEIRCFNGSLNPEDIRADVMLCLALNYMALTQRGVWKQYPQRENDKFALRTFLNRAFCMGDEFECVRKMTRKNLTGNSARRHGNGGWVN